MIGDLHIPHREIEIPEKYKELLIPGKVQHVICPGNPGNQETIDWLYSLASAKSNCHFTKGDFDENPNFPETKVINIGNIKIGIVHGHQVVPWGDLEALAAVQRELDCDILISGHTHQH